MSDDNHSGMLNEGAVHNHDGNDSQESLTPNDPDQGTEGTGGGPQDGDGVVDTFNPGTVPPNRNIERESQTQSPDIEAGETDDTEK